MQESDIVFHLYRLTQLYDDYSEEEDEVDSDFLNAQWIDDLFSNLVRVGVTHVTCKLK